MTTHWDRLVNNEVFSKRLEDEKIKRHEDIDLNDLTKRVEKVLKNFLFYHVGVKHWFVWDPGPVYIEHLQFAFPHVDFSKVSENFLKSYKPISEYEALELIKSVVSALRTPDFFDFMDHKSHLEIRSRLRNRLVRYF